MTSNNKEERKNWEYKLGERLGRYFKDSGYSVMWILDEVEIILSQQREQTLKILTDEIATAHTSKEGTMSCLTSAYTRIKNLK